MGCSIKPPTGHELKIASAGTLDLSMVHSVTAGVVCGSEYSLTCFAYYQQFCLSSKICLRGSFEFSFFRIHRLLKIDCESRFINVHSVTASHTNSNSAFLKMSAFVVHWSFHPPQPHHIPLQKANFSTQRQ